MIITTSDSPSQELLALVQALAMARSMDDIIDLVRLGARRLTGAEGVTFVLRDGAQCFYGEANDVGPLWKGQRFPIDSCVSGWAMLRREAIVIDNVHAEDRIPHDAYCFAFAKSLVTVPVRRDDPVAAIGAYWSRTHGAGPDEVKLLETIAETAAVAIANAELYQSLRTAAVTAEWQAMENARLLRLAERELSERHRSEAKLQAAVAAKSRFLAAASHDLRQPFQAMRLFFEVLSAQLSETAHRDVASKLNDSMKAGEALLAALLDMSVLDAGAVRVNLEPLPIDSLLAELVEEMEPQAAAKSLELRHVPSRRVVVSDRVILARMLRNLLTNAVRYTYIGKILVGCRGIGDRMRIEVWDTGVGISPDQIDLIFDDFYQVGNDARNRSGGLGIGLAVVRRMAHLCGHRLSVRSEPGRGSVFFLTLSGTLPPAS